jgi:hypothetical protein
VIGMLPAFDISALPLVVITYPSYMTLAEANAYAQQLDQVLQGGRIGTVVDIRALDSSAVTSTDRKHLAAVIDAVTKARAGALVAEAIVLDSPILRGLYTAYCWLRTDRSYPSRAFAKVDQARAWVGTELTRAGVGATTGSA